MSFLRNVLIRTQYIHIEERNPANYTCIENTTDIWMGRTYDCKLILGIKVISRDNVLTLTTNVGNGVCVFFKYT